MSEKVQPFADLAPDVEAALRDSIKRFGVVVPIVVDKSNRIIDGHHRSRIARDLGVPCPQVTRSVKDDTVAHELAYSLNADRRQMTAEQRQAVAADLRGRGYSFRAIADVTGVSPSQTQRDIEAAGVPRGTPQASEQGEQSPDESKSKGKDDKQYQRKQSDAHRDAAAAARAATRAAKKAEAEALLAEAASNAEQEHPEVAALAAWQTAYPALKPLFALDPDLVASSIPSEIRGDTEKFADVGEQWFTGFLQAMKPDLKVVGK